MTPGPDDDLPTGWGWLVIAVLTWVTLLVLGMWKAAELIGGAS